MMINTKKNALIGLRDGKKGEKRKFLLYLGKKIGFSKIGGGGQISIFLIIYTPGILFVRYWMLDARFLIDMQ